MSRFSLTVMMFVAVVIAGQQLAQNAPALQDLPESILTAGPWVLAAVNALGVWQLGAKTENEEVVEAEEVKEDSKDEKGGGWFAFWES